MKRRFIANTLHGGRRARLAYTPARETSCPWGHRYYCYYWPGYRRAVGKGDDDKSCDRNDSAKLLLARIRARNCPSLVLPLRCRSRARLGHAGRRRWRRRRWLGRRGRRGLWGREEGEEGTKKGEFHANLPCPPPYAERRHRRREEPSPPGAKRQCPSSAR